MHSGGQPGSDSDMDSSDTSGPDSPPTQGSDADPVSPAASLAVAAPAAPGPVHQPPWLDGDVLVFPSPLSPHALCPVIGRCRSYANQTQGAIRQSLMRHQVGIPCRPVRLWV